MILTIFLVFVQAGLQPAIAQSNEDCLVCHGEKTFTVERQGREVSLSVDQKAFGMSAHQALDCIMCHEGFDPAALPHARTLVVDCTSCHADESIDALGTSVHGGKTPLVSCVDCHTAHTVKKFSSLEPSAVKVAVDSVCAGCHADVMDNYRASGHGKAVASGSTVAPSCGDCHGTHGVLAVSDSLARTSRKNEAALCLSCHLDKEEVRAKVGPSAGFIGSYENSVHGQASRRGNVEAAICTDCHGSHAITRGSNPSSPVAKLNLAATCGKCHPAIEHKFSESIHGTALQNGLLDAPTCTNCHGEHGILSPKDPRSPTAPLNVSAQVCSPCHASVRLTEKYGLASNRFQSFEDSFHGLASRAGSVEVANCASCHGVHDIRPSSDPTSRINRKNLAKTCGTCHPGANENFAKGAVHVISEPGSENTISLVATAYLMVIGVTIGGMLFHNLVDFYRRSKVRLLRRRGLVAYHHPGHRLYLRMSLGERVQHGALILSFFTLVVTGFMLRFPDAWWVVSLRDVIPSLFELRGIVHRVAGVALVGAGLYHIYYVLRVPRGKQLLRDLLPKRQDISDAIDVMKYNLGLSPRRPLFGRFSYIEKSEYWALVWGTIVMAVTGVILWFDNTFLNLLTKLWWDVSRTIHYYEAWLATLAIIVWHFYFIMFNPDSYPMNVAWWKGTLTEEEMEEEHPLELIRIRELESRQAEAEKKETESDQESQDT